MKEFIKIIESIGFVKGRSWWTLPNGDGTEWVIEIVMPSEWTLSWRSGGCHKQGMEVLESTLLERR